MENILERLTVKAARVIKNWWLFLVCGILSLLAGIAVLADPIESYLTFSLVLGAVMAATGIVEIVAACTSRNYFMTRGWNIAGGVLDLLIGMFLMCSPRIELVALPVFAGMWIMYHGFMYIALASDMASFKVRGYGWMIASAVLLIILSILMLFDPLSFGAAAVVWLIAFSMLLLGIVLIMIAFRLHYIHKEIKAAESDKQ